MREIDLSALWSAMWSGPHDPLTWSALADHLEEDGRLEDAARVRAPVPHGGCLYCHAGPDACPGACPDRDDADRWAELATLHVAGCPWIDRRAGQTDGREACIDALADHIHEELARDGRELSPRTAHRLAWDFVVGAWDGVDTDVDSWVAAWQESQAHA